MCVEGIKLDGFASQFQRLLLALNRPKHAGMSNVLYGVHIRQTAVRRRELRCGLDDLGKLSSQAVPVFWIECANQRLAAQPSIIQSQGDIRSLGETAETFDRQVHVERHRDSSDDAPLRVKPIVQFEFETVTPNEETGIQLF